MANETTKQTQGRVARELLTAGLAELGLEGVQKTGYVVYPIAHDRQLRLWMNQRASSCGRIETMGFSMAGKPGFHGIPEAERDGRAESGIEFSGDAADVLERVRQAVEAAVTMPVTEKPKRRAPGVVEHQELPAEKKDDVASVRAIQDPEKLAKRLALIKAVAAAKGQPVSSSLDDLFVAQTARPSDEDAAGISAEQ